MRYRNIPKKATVFKIFYLVLSLLVAAYTAFILIENLVHGIKAGLVFDDTILMIASLFALLFESSITGFIIRSLKHPTILMKNLVFKNDGTPFWVGLIPVAIVAVVTLALSVLMFVSAFITNLFTMNIRGQYFLLAVMLIVSVNLSFTTIYFFTFRHESGSFTII